MSKDKPASKPDDTSKPKTERELLQENYLDASKMIRAAVVKAASEQDLSTIEVADILVRMSHEFIDAERKRQMDEALDDDE